MLFRSDESLLNMYNERLNIKEGKNIDYENYKSNLQKQLSNFERLLKNASYSNYIEYQINYLEDQIAKAKEEVEKTQEKIAKANMVPTMDYDRIYQIEEILKDLDKRLTKELNKENIKESNIKEIEKQRSNQMLVKMKNSIKKISVERIMYAEVLGRNMSLYLQNGDKVETVMTMIELEAKLKEDKRFIKPHRSYMINLDFIEILKTNEIKMSNGNILPMSKKNYITVKEAFLQHCFKNE